MAIASKKSASNTFKEQAKRYGFTIRNVSGEGNCFFHVIMDQFFNLNPNEQDDFNDLKKLTHQQLRSRAIAHITDHSEEYQSFFDETDGKDFHSFVDKLMEDRAWAENILAIALSRALKINLKIIRSDAELPTIIESKNPRATLHLGYIVGVHYLSLRSIDYQSVVGNERDEHMSTINPEINYRFKPKVIY